VTSALSGEGIAELTAAISQRLVPNPTNPGDAVPFASPHIEWIEAVAAAVLPGGQECKESV
jgi:hypothetical protein